MLFQEPGQKLSGIRPRRRPTRFPAFQGCKGQIKKMRPEKHHRFGLRKPVGSTPEKKQADRGIKCFRWRPRVSLHIEVRMRNQRLDRKKILLFLSSIYLKGKIARFLACSLGVTMREIALAHGS
jgi:hypothetical protein